MFVRVKTSPKSPKKAVQIVKNVRVGNKVTQKIIRHVGTALTEEELQRLLELAEFIKASIQDSVQPTLFSPEDMAEVAIKARKQKKEEKALPVDLKDLREEKRIITGIHEVYGEVYKEVGFNRVISARKPSVRNTLYHIVMARIANPLSKMATVENLEKHFGVTLSLSSVYRMMDTLDDRAEEKIKKMAYQSAKALFPESLKAVFYDLTTLYFESFTEDELKDYGYSKDMKFNQVQVLLGIVVTESGLPIAYKVYNGSTYEGNTLKDAIEQLRSEYQIQDVVFVADSAILSKRNIELLEGLNKQYILGARLKNLPEDIKKEILNKESYISLDKEGYSIKEIEYKGKRLIVSYSPVRAQKDAYDRERAIEKLLKKSKTEELISNYGYKKYLKINGDTTIQLDEEKIKRDALWDGIHGVITNNRTMKAEEILRQYHGLWQIEETFRVTKHDIKVRPIFHWTPRRIKAHIAICFMALTLIRHLQYRMKVLGKGLSAEKIRQALLSVQLSILRDIKTNHVYAIPSAITTEAKEIYKAVGLKLSDVPYRIK